MTANLSGNPESAPIRRPTLRQVAEVAGVSIAVVSYAFSRPDRVAPSTRERVLAAAAALGYSGPDPTGRALRLGRVGAIGLIGPAGATGLLDDPATMLIARGLAAACDRAGVALTIAGETVPALDGVVLVRGATATYAGAAPAVVVDPADPTELPHIGADVRAGAAAAAAHLAALGHQRLVVITWPEAGERFDGARDGWGTSAQITGYVAAGTSQADGEMAARRALRTEPRPTAILALADGLALGALDAARQLGLSVPADVSVVGIDDLPGSDGLGLTTVFVPYLPMGELAGSTLAALMRGDAFASPPLLPTALTLRATTGPPLPA
jgi:DNA-binding LacI/PurR family transcriptional regulator